MNISFGVYPEASIAEVRSRRKTARELLAQDIDPQSRRDKQREDAQAANSLTLEKVIHQWFEVKKTAITPSYADDIIRSLNNHVIPRLGKLPLHEVAAPEVIHSLKPLANTGKLEAVKRVCQPLNEVMTYAVNIGLITHNPLAGILHAFENPKTAHNPTLKPEELAEFMQVLKIANIRPVTHYLILWQLHTMIRPGETAAARWDEIDVENALWAIPAKRMKKRREHIIPLSSHALVLLKMIKSISGKGNYLFPSDINPRKHANASTANMALKRMGFQDRLTTHGMRAPASATLNEQGFDSDVIEAALAHVDKNAVRSAYNRAQYLERRKVMMN